MLEGDRQSVSVAEYRQAGFFVIGEAVVDELVAVLPLGVEGFLGAGEGECRAVDGAVGLVDQVELRAIPCRKVKQHLGSRDGTSGCTVNTVSVLIWWKMISPSPFWKRALYS